MFYEGKTVHVSPYPGVEEFLCAVEYFFFVLRIRSYFLEPFRREDNEDVGIVTLRVSSRIIS